MNEQWLPVVNYEGFYEISNLGNLKSLGRTLENGHHFPEKIIGFINKTGYKICSLSNGTGKGKQFLIHRLVLAAFIGPCPEGMESCHNDGIRANAALSNLRYDTHQNNNIDRMRHGTLPKGSKFWKAKLKEEDVLLIFKDERRIKDIAKEHGVDDSTILDIKKKRSWAWLTNSSV